MNWQISTIIVICIMNTVAKLHNLNDLNKPNEILTNCLETILEKIAKLHKHNMVILNYSKNNISLVKKWPFITYNYCTDIANMYQNTHLNTYIIEENIQDIRSTITMLLERRVIYSRRWFIFISEFDQRTDFSFFTRHYISQVIAINKDLNIFTIDPYKYENINYPEKFPFQIGRCIDIENVPIEKYAKKYPKKWRNTTVREYFRVLPPLTSKQKDGVEDKIFNMFKETLKFQNRRKSVDKVMNLKDMDYQAYIQKDKLERYKIDIFAGYLQLLPEDPYNYDISPVTAIEKIVWITHASKPKPTWIRATEIFPIELYLGLLLMLVVTTILAKYIFNVKFSIYIIIVLKILLESPALKKNCKFSSIKLLIIGWIWFSLITTSIFRNTLIIITVSTSRDQPFNCLKDIIEAELSIISSVDILSKFNNSNDIKLDHRKVSFCNFEECLNRTAFEINVATNFGSLITKIYGIPKHYIDENGESMLHVTNDILITFGTHWLFTKGHPLVEPCSRLLSALGANGWLTYTYDTLNFATEVRMFKLNKHRTSVSIESIEFIFVCWVIGMLIAFFVFCCELGVNILYLKIEKMFEHKIKATIN